MLEKPDLPDALISDHARAGYGLLPAGLEFLPLGADIHTAVYRLETSDGAAYFLKLRAGEFEPITVQLPDFLSHAGIRAVIPPLRTLTGQLWIEFEGYHLIVYPFVEGKDGYQAALSEPQWVEYGRALKALHTVSLPDALAGQIPREGFDGRWREQVRRYQRLVEQQSFRDSTAARLAVFMREKRGEIDHMLARAETLAAGLRASAEALVLCHADIHPGNLHLSPDGRLSIVDWDNPRYALKELDLMFAGGVHSSPSQNTRQEALFFQGYGPAQVNRAALAYYRYERVIEDVAAFGEQLLESSAGSENREQALTWCMSSFLPGHELDTARQTDPRP